MCNVKKAALNLNYTTFFSTNDFYFEDFFLKLTII